MKIWRLIMSGPVHVSCAMMPRLLSVCYSHLVFGCIDTEWAGGAAACIAVTDMLVDGVASPLLQGLQFPRWYVFGELPSLGLGLCFPGRNEFVMVPTPRLRLLFPGLVRFHGWKDVKLACFWLVMKLCAASMRRARWRRRESILSIGDNSRQLPLKLSCLHNPMTDFLILGLPRSWLLACLSLV